MSQDTEEKRVVDKRIDDLKSQAADCLNNRYFFAASNLYQKILELDPNDRDGRFGSLLCKNEINDENEFVPIYQNLFSDEEFEIKIACDREDEHINEMCEKCFLPGYFEKEDIRKIYDYDLSYRSCLFSRKKQKEKILREIDSDSDLSWLKENGFYEINEILKAYDRRIDDAQEEDQKTIENIKNEYQRFLYKTYADVKRLYNEAKDRKEEDYRKLVHQFENSFDVDELRDLALQFDHFKDYKDSGKYVESCNKKIEELKEKEKDESHRKNVEDTLINAKAALVTGKYDEAYDGFAGVISLDPENEEARLGILMSQTKTSDEEELFGYYKNLYNEEHSEILEACEEDRNHIDEMVEKYYLPDYLEKETIREKYLFDRKYESSLSSRVRQEEQFREDVETNPAFLWLKQNGSEKVKQEIDSVYEAYSDRTKKAREEDKKNIERIKNEYQRFLFKTYASIKKLHQIANNKKEDLYKKLIKNFDQAGNERDYEKLIDQFEELSSYKESDRYVTLCHQRIDELKKIEEDAATAQELETTLIAARAYLASGNRDLADKNFTKVLSIDPDNADAYLGFLMIDIGVKSTDELIDYYEHLYDDINESESLIACEEDSEHIDAMLEKYYLPGYLEKETIRRYYNFDRHYRSITSSRVERKEQFNEELRMNPLFIRILSSEKKEITSIIDSIMEYYEEQIREAKKADAKQVDSVKRIYEAYLEESDKTVQKIYEEKLKEKNENDEVLYRENLIRFEKDLSVEELEELANRFDEDYKDGASYKRKCRERIKTLRIAKENDRLKKLLAEGTELLDVKLYADAKDRFSSYLAIDPDNEEAHLKLLMSEVKVSDVLELFEYYKELYSDEIPETKTAVEEDSDHIDEMCEKCSIPGLLEKDTIEKKYEFDRSYVSLLDCRIKQVDQIEDEIELNPSLSWLYENGSRKIKRQINDVLSVYDNRVKDAEAEDDRLAKNVIKEYRRFVRDTDREVRALYNDLIKERNEQIKREALEKKEAEERFRAEEERKKREEEERETLKKAEAIRLEKEKRQAEEEQRKLQKAYVENNRLEQQARKEKGRLEKQALDRKEREKEKEKARAARLEKAEQRRAQKEQKALEKAAQRQARKEKKAFEKANKERRQIRLNPAIVMAVFSIIALMVVVYLFALVPGRKYNNAISLVNEGKYDEAVEIFEGLGNFRDSAFQIKNTIYKKADDLFKKGDLVEAAKIFNDVKFDDSEDRLKQIKDRLINEAKTGDSILFGEFEQDGLSENGKEMIEWIVLDKQEGSILVVSKYALEAQKFNSRSEEVYWENCSLRSWLNGRFADNAFSNEDPSAVLQATLLNYRYPEAEDEEDVDLSEIVPTEYETRDRLFLLSLEEVEQYYSEEEDRVCEATEYAIENGVAASAKSECDWWLRNPGSETRSSTNYIKASDGSVSSSMNDLINAVRPAMWIKTK